MVIEDSLKKVWRYVRRHQNPAQGLEKSYVSEIARETGLNRETVHDAVQCLEDMGLVRKSRQEGKALITVDVGLEPDAGTGDELDPGSGRWESEESRAWP